MPRQLQFRPPGHGKLPNNPNNKLKVDPLAFIGDNPYATMTEEILFGAANSLLQIVDYTTGLDLLPAAQALENTFGTSFGGTGFPSFLTYLGTQPATDSISGLPTPSTDPAGLLTELLSWLTGGFGTLGSGQTILSQLIAAGGGTGNSLSDFGGLFAALGMTAEEIAQDIFGVSGGSLPLLGGNLMSMLGNPNLNVPTGFDPITAGSAMLQQVLAPAGALTNWTQIPAELLGNIGIGSLSADTPNQLKAPLFEIASEVVGAATWFVDNTQTAPGTTTPGSVYVDATGIDNSLLSNVLDVAPGQTLTHSVYTKWSGASAGAGNAITLGLNLYDAAKTPIGSSVLLQAITAPASTGAWQQLSGSYLVPANARYAIMTLNVLSPMTAGRVWFGNAAHAKTGFLPNNLIKGLGSYTTLAAYLQDLVDLPTQTLLGTSLSGYLPADLATALTGIPADHVRGVAGISGLGSTMQQTWDQMTQAFRSDTGLSGVSLSELSNAAGDTSNLASEALNRVQMNTGVLNFRNNKRVTHSLESGTEANFDLALLGTGTTPTSFAVTQSTAAMGFIRIAATDAKTVVWWMSTGNANITNFYVNFYKQDASGNLNWLYTTADLAGQLGTSWVYQHYNLPTALNVSPGDNIGIEFQVIGTGTLTIAGITPGWQVNHPTARLKRFAAQRNTGTTTVGSGQIAAASIGWSNNTPWVGLGITAAPAYYPPVTREFTTSGAQSYTIPTYLVAGDLIDLIPLGAGGGSFGGISGEVGYGGLAGVWNPRTLVMGTDIPMTTTTLTINPGSPGAAGPSGGAGGAGGSTIITGTGVTTITAAGGAGGNGVTFSLVDGLSNGRSPGNQLYNGVTYAGGTSVGTNSPGSPPGGGAGGGYYSAGYPGAQGYCAVVARQQ